MTDEQLAIFMRQILARIASAAGDAEAVMTTDNVPEGTRRAVMAPFETLSGSLHHDVRDLLGDF